jgi:cytochrome c-type biogenesis protein CcmH/NrfF
MRLSKHSLKRGFLFLVLAGLALAQTESQIESDEVKRVGAHINCQCGSCTENVDCNMSSGQCHFCKPARTKIWEMQKAGVDDSGIIAYFKKQYGEGIFRADPNSFFWTIPYVALLAGAFLLWIVLKRMRGTPHMRPATPSGSVPAAGSGFSDDPILARYRDHIEKETDRLE